MGRKGKLFGLLAVFAAIGLVTASGAFTTVSAERTASVNVAGDSSALLALEPTDSSNGKTYADISNGQLEINLANGSASGVNPNANTTIASVFRITNQGTQEVNVTITDSGSSGYSDAVTFYNGTTNLETNGKDIPTGNSIIVKIEVDTTGVSGTPSLVDTITITAEATGNCRAARRRRFDLLIPRLYRIRIAAAPTFDRSHRC